VLQSAFFGCVPGGLILAIVGSHVGHSVSLAVVLGSLLPTGGYGLWRGLTSKLEVSDEMVNSGSVRSIMIRNGVRTYRVRATEVAEVHRFDRWNSDDVGGYLFRTLQHRSVKSVATFDIAIRELL
jgi:hypothetical protein